MNRFEQGVYECMDATSELLETTTKPLHRAMLLNFWRHVHLEGAGEYEQIVAPDMMVDEPGAGGPTTADYMAALSETRPTLTKTIVDEFTEDIATIARL